MARKILVLGRSIRHANAYARVAGLERGYRPVVSAGQIRNTRNAELHVLPSFLVRPDRHAILAALRHARLEVFYVDPDDFKVDEDPRGDLTERQLATAYRYNALRKSPVEAEEEFHAADMAEVEKPKPAPRKPRTPKAAPAVAPADFFGS